MRCVKDNADLTLINKEPDGFEQSMRMHDCRYIAATDMYTAAITEREIMDVAGWNTTMLSTYQHVDSVRSAQKINNK